MRKKVLGGFWAFLYVMCAILGLVEPTTRLQGWGMTVLAVLFFLPPAVMLMDAFKNEDRQMLFRLRLISILSLALTLTSLIVNIAVVGASEKVGVAMYIILDIVSVPMICSRHYVLSMFLWACLLFAAVPKLWGKKE